MAIQTFIIFLNALMNLNTPTEATNTQKHPRTDIQTVKPQQTSMARGGWDAN